MSMRAELARAARLWPELRPEQLLSMATVAGGEALGGAFGALLRGRRCDLAVVGARATWSETLAAFVAGEAPLLSVRVAGRRRRPAR
jgi:cytosine/adenosine deaminase-related metal-dependent hydrolase